MRRKTILIASVVLISLAGLAVAYTSQPLKLRSLEIIGKNGGPNGFYSIEAECNVLGDKIYSEVILKDSGYSKLSICPPIDVREDVKPIIDLFTSTIESNKSIDTAYIFFEYKVIMKVEDRGNFYLNVE